jgi:hypothetical protein
MGSLVIRLLNRDAGKAPDSGEGSADDGAREAGG